MREINWKERLLNYSKEQQEPFFEERIYSVEAVEFIDSLDQDSATVEAIIIWAYEHLHIVVDDPALARKTATDAFEIYYDGRGESYRDFAEERVADEDLSAFVAFWAEEYHLCSTAQNAVDSAKKISAERGVLVFDYDPDQEALDALDLAIDEKELLDLAESREEQELVLTIELNCSHDFFEENQLCFELMIDGFPESEKGDASFICGDNNRPYISFLMHQPLTSDAIKEVRALPWVSCAYGSAQ